MPVLYRTTNHGHPPTRTIFPRPTVIKNTFNRCGSPASVFRTTKGNPKQPSNNLQHDRQTDCLNFHKRAIAIFKNNFNRQAKYVYRNNEARSRNQCCHGKA